MFITGVSIRRRIRPASQRRLLTGGTMRVSIRFACASTIATIAVSTACSTSSGGESPPAVTAVHPTGPIPAADRTGLRGTVAYSTRSFELWVINADGSGAYRLTDWPGGDSAGTWLSSGEIVFAHFTGDEPLPKWYIVRPDGTRLRSLPWFSGAGDPLDWVQPAATALPGAAA